ncbi:MAG: hypothetical protein WB615_15995 [Candidatus Tumulicola sp.]
MGHTILAIEYGSVTLARIGRGWLDHRRGRGPRTAILFWVVGVIVLTAGNILLPIWQHQPSLF